MGADDVDVWCCKLAKLIVLVIFGLKLGNPLLLLLAVRLEFGVLCNGNATACWACCWACCG